MLDAKTACENTILQVAQEMCLAAITAPKACGRDSITCGVLTGEEITALVNEMRRIEDETKNCRPIFYRDGALVEQCEAVVLIGALHQARGVVPCGLCGNGDCGTMARTPGQHCAFDDIDLGIAVGSAAALAADRRVDNRVLYSAGIAAMNLKLLGEKAGTIIAIPLTASNRNIFFFGR